MAFYLKNKSLKTEAKQNSSALMDPAMREWLHLNLLAETSLSGVTSQVIHGALSSPEGSPEPPMLGGGGRLADFSDEQRQKRKRREAAIPMQACPCGS